MHMSDEAKRGKSTAEHHSPGRRPPWWAFRVSTGITARVWFPMLARHRFRVSPSRLPAAIAASLIGLGTALPAASQRRRLGAAIAAEPLLPPVFIVGHWRSGTTFLHELLATDPRFVAPNYLQSFATDHFLRWENVLRRFEAFLPKRRPMDDVAAGWDRPQEDEFALLAMGAPSPYEVMLFPNDRDGAISYLDIEALPDPRRKAWEEALLTTLKRIAFARRQSSRAAQAAEWFLLKSPTHTARVGLLQRMFPDARFIHVIRDPFAVHVSSEHLWRRMFDSQGFQRPRYGGSLALDRFVNASMKELYRNFDSDIASLPGGRYAEVRYEDLIADPIAQVTRLRGEIGLPEPDMAALQAHLDDVRDYRRNRFTLDAETAETIRREWRWYFDRFGYPDTPPI